MLVLRFAWRNTWRNARRTGIVLTAVAIGISGTLVSMAFNVGMVVQMIETAIQTDLGHVQIHARGFDANPELHVLLEDGGRRELRVLGELPGVAAYARRVLGEGLVSSPRSSAGVRLVGIEPENEARVTRVADSVVEGVYLDGDGRRVLIGETLARRLAVGVGDKLVVSVQDLAGDLSGEALRVSGLYRTASNALDRSTVFVRLEESQALLGLGGAISELVVVASSRDRIQEVRDALAGRLSEAEVRSWGELQPVLVYMVDLMDQSAVLLYAAIFIAMAFGIANVLLMTIYERTREIGILRAVGFGRLRLVESIVIEALIVILLGLAIGFAIALGAVWWLEDGIELGGFAEGLNAYGIGSRIRPVLRLADFTNPTFVAVVTALLASAWPAWRAVRLVPAEAVRQT